MTTESAPTFGRYQLLGTLGRGGFATVYRARDPLLNREVALKTLLPHLAEDMEIRDRFIAESQRIAQLHHPNIVTVYDVGEADGRPFFTMELIEGYTLNRMMGGGNLSLEQVIELMQGLCSAVDYLHEHRLVHRDIKPANIMIDEQSGRVVLMDFGVARAVDQTQYTQAGMSIGTPTAMAPEQVQGKPAGPAADIYAIGVLTYQLLSGKPPFSGDTAYILYAHAHEPPPPLRDQVPDLPEWTYEAVDAALAKEPEQRPATAMAFAAALAGEPLPAPRSTDTTRAGFTARTPSTRSRLRAIQPAEGGEATVVGPATAALDQTAVMPPSAQTGVLETAVPPRRRFPVLPVAIGGAVAVLAIGGIAYAVTSGGSKSPKPSPTAASTGVVTVVAPPATPAPATTSAVATAPTGTPGATAPPSTPTPPPTPQPTPPPLAAGYTVNTFAGARGGGYADGPLASAQFNAPSGLAISSAGRIYVADFQNQRIRVIAPDGTVSTLAGNGTAGYRDGAGAQAQFASPSGIALDTAGNVYVADAGNNRIRKIAPNGTVSTLAGSGQKGFFDGPGAQAGFDQPGAVAVDRAGNVFVADFNNQRIRKIDTGGNVTTFAGSGEKGWADGPGAQARFSSPAAITADASGNLYVVDFDNPRVRKITPAGDVSTVAGSGDKGSADGPALKAQFARPGGLTVDQAGNIYIADTGNNRIRFVSTAGEVSTLAGTGAPGKTDGPGTTAELDGPSDVGLDAAGNLYVADIENSLIRKITRTSR